MGSLPRQPAPRQGSELDGLWPVCEGPPTVMAREAGTLTSHGRLPTEVSRPPCPLRVHRHKTGKREVRVGRARGRGTESFSLLPTIGCFTRIRGRPENSCPPQPSNRATVGNTVHSLVHLTNICHVSVTFPAPMGDGLVNQGSRLHRDQSSASNKQLKGQETCGVGGHEHAVLEGNLGKPWGQGGP